MQEHWSPDEFPQVTPDAKFRQDLHRALAQTHRQHMVQRRLGTRTAATTPPVQRAQWLLIVGLLMLVAVVVYWWQRQD